jgi:hypothetical protein
MLLCLSESKAPGLKMMREKWDTRAEASRYGVAALEQEGQVDYGLQFQHVECRLRRVRGVVVN